MSQCQCDAGYEPNGTATACVVPPTEEQSCKTANPVQPGTGRKRFTETDYSGAGAHPLTLARQYSSRWTDSATATGLTPIAAWDGGWRHSYQANLTLRADGSLRAFRPDGTMLGFTASATVANTWTAAGSTDTVTAITNGQRTGYTYTAAADDSVETYDATGKLQSIKARNGWLTTLSYSDATTPSTIAPRPGLLTSVKNQFGRELKFTYDAQGRLAELLPPGAIAGQPAGSAISPIRYAYSEAASLGAGVPAQSQLTSAVWQDGSTRRYHHEDARWPQAVTGITDEAGVRYGSYAYDAQGRVTRSELAGGAERLDFAYASDANGKPSTTVTDYSGAGGAATSRSYTFTDIGNVRYPSSLTAPCSLCGSTQQSSTYDTAGNPIKQIAHDGTVTFIAYDAKARETERATYASSYQTATTRPALSAASKVISTQWHATYNLPTQVAEPNKTTANSYSSKGLLTGQSWTATTDATGAAKFTAVKTGSTYATTWSYSASSLATTVVEKETDAGATVAVETSRWTLTYNALGDLTKITNAAVTPNSVATVTSYSLTGQPLTGKTSDGKTFTYTYRADRQVATLRLSDGYLTTYSYNNRAQLIEARASDGGLVTIDYSSAGKPTRYAANGEVVFDTTATSALVAGSTPQSALFAGVNAQAAGEVTLPRPVPLPEIDWGGFGPRVGDLARGCTRVVGVGLSLLLFSSEVGTCSTVDSQERQECKKDPCANELPTSDAARREAMRRFGLPVGSSIPVASSLDAPGYEQYVYWFPSKGIFVVLSHHPPDKDHKCPHWHAGQAKMDPEGSTLLSQIRRSQRGVWQYWPKTMVAHRKEQSQ